VKHPVSLDTGILDNRKEGKQTDLKKREVKLFNSFSPAGNFDLRGARGRILLPGIM